MKPLKLMTILGTRPEIIRLSLCIKAFDEFFEHTLVHTGQNWDYTLNQIFFENLDIREPDFYLDAVGENLGQTMGNIIAKSYEVMLEVKPDAVLILGDTNTTLAAISAKRLRIPIFHMEAGTRCFDQKVPEEINRRIIDHISDVQLPYSEYGRRNLIAEGIGQEHIFVIGSTIKEILDKYSTQIDESNVLQRLNLEKEKYILVSAHREENVDDYDTFLALMNSLNSIAKNYNMPIIYSTHPRSKKRIEESGFRFNPLVKRLEPFGFFDYNNLQKNAYCVLSDSGILSEESAILDFPSVLIRTATDRPEVIENGNTVIGGIDEQGIERAVELSRKMWEMKAHNRMPSEYQRGNVSNNVVKIIQSYTKLITRG